MPNNAPTNADLGVTPELREQDTAAAVLSDDRMDETPGGGGLRGGGAGGPHAGSAEGRAGAATPNSPIDAHAPHRGDASNEGGDALAETEARTRALGDEPSERTAP